MLHILQICGVLKASTGLARHYLKDMRTKALRQYYFVTEAIVKRAQNIKAHYDDMKVERFLVRIPGSWEGIQAVKELEAQGIPCHVTLIYRSGFK